ncbi:DUF1232 domain-containing protein [Desulfonema ishimotonii]|uniref:DUF1232 domain-containing protein n=1 Tax=Desulfonema ishimotonii TaxID=45657 RepID=A0A401FX48_9BACT|nr:YkvA family protein [Desulfonema ishimotonii]GBC61504.1 DUF1232 domain-containing protein [Desulfonema ishimotonii]
MNETRQTEKERSFMTTPLSARGVPVFVVYLLAFIGGVYILNPGAGVIELIPDNIPIIGNLDEGGAFLAIWYGLLEYFEGRKYRRQDDSAPN